MSITPIVKNDTPFSLHYFTTDESGIFDLTGYTITLVMLNVSVHASPKYGAGNWTITNAAQGIATYQFVTADTSSPGIWRIYPIVTGPTTRHFDDQILEILDLP